MPDNLTAERTDETVVTGTGGDLDDGHADGDVLANGDVLADDVLVEEVSIDGMCGVY